MRSLLKTLPPCCLALAMAGLSPVAVAGQSLPTLTTEDYGQWQRLGGATLSPDGSWITVTISRVNEEGELQIRRTADPDSVIVVAYGQGPRFSDDGRWLAYSVGSSPDARERAQEQGRPLRNKMALMELATGETEEIENVASFTFSPDGGYLAMRRFAPRGDRDASGVDVVVRELDRGLDTNFGNVSEFAWQEESPLLAMIVDAEGMAGNGLQLFDAREGRITVLDSEAALYSELTWREDAHDLALLRTVPRDAEGEDSWTDTARVVLAFAAVDGAPAKSVFEPAAAAGFPADHRIVPWEGLRWNDDGQTLFFGIQERSPKPVECEEPEEEEDVGAGSEAGPGTRGESADGDGVEEGGAGDPECEEEDGDRPTVEIWHAVDVDIVPTQKVRANGNRRENDLSAWHLSVDRFVRLENDLTENVQVVEGLDYAIGRDQTPYEVDRMFGPVFNDIYVVELADGERRKVLDRIERFYGASEEGRYLLYLMDDHYWTLDLESGARTNITQNVPTSFIDHEDDHTVDQKPPFGTSGWLENDAAVLINDKHDIWSVAPDGSGAERLTWGADDNVRYRRVRIDPEEEAIDPDRAQYFTIYDDWKEMNGYARASRLGAEPEPLLWGEMRYTGLRKAEEADLYLYQVSSFVDSPDYFVADNDRLRNGRQVTATNPFQKDFAWGKAELIEFENAWGQRLQGALYYPANYEPGQQYPMITYIYEIRSNQVHAYHVPSERSYYNFQGWVQDGYFVFQPDIVYRDRDPGVSAVASLEPAVQAVIETGMVDPERIGLIGHSWGGYQTTFAVTQTDVFAAGVAGAPLTNLFSMYLSVYWNTGGTDARIFEISQGRMEVPFWEDEASYRRNSPVYHIENMNTPLLMAQGTEDGAVEFNQGVEFYNAARRAGKDFVFLVYNDENHGFSREPNQLDYHTRITEWFAHYLKGEPAPEWIEKGVPYLEQPGGLPRSGGGGGRGGGPGGGETPNGGGGG